ncbi:MAG: C40 family peptidase [Candidatus Eisenbacteria bacterium]|nr:C40 family peptidase [Candidatus Eisenbacteria bacterium]
MTLRPGALPPTRPRVMAPAGVTALALALALLTGAAFAKEPRGEGAAAPDSSPGLSAAAEAAVRATIALHLKRPYVWGACGLKSFDCSGFVWRVMSENGILIKRTTARKYYMCLPKVAEGDRWNFGNLVFFSDLKHCGIVDTPETFYHAAVSAGTHQSRFDPVWRRRISGVRAMPRIEQPAAARE